MNVTQLRPPSVIIRAKHVSIEHTDTFASATILCAATQLNLAAQYYAETGKIEVAKALGEAAHLANRIYEDTKPHSPLGNANECAELNDVR